MQDKILLLDIEWKPTKAYVWQPWKENITPEKIIEHGGLLCVGYKWLGKPRTTVVSEWKHGRDGMLQKTHEVLSQAEAVVTYNGDKYDLRKLNGEFMLSDMPPPPPVTSIDVLKTVKKMGYFMNRLAFIGPFLGLGHKVSHSGMSLWTSVMDGDKKAQTIMTKYCKQDVDLLEELYLKIRPYITDHPQLVDAAPRSCGACGSTHMQSRGYRRTKSFRIQRLQCQDCGAWQSGTRQKVT